MRTRLAGIVFCIIGWLMIGGVHAESGLLWKIEDGKGSKPSYLFGTIHTDDPRVNAFSPVLRAALASTDSFMLETLPPERPGLTTLARGTLRDWLEPEEIAELLRQADAQSLRDEVALRMKPWLLATVLAQPRAGGMLSQDMQLMGMAADHDKPVLGLERAEEHFGALDGLPMEDQLALLRAVLQQRPEDRERDYEIMVQAYLSRDVARMLAVSDQLNQQGLPPGLWPRLRAILLDARNARMAERLMAQLQQGTVFATAGASHLGGPGGLLARLRAAGYRLTPLE